MWKEFWSWVYNVVKHRYKTGFFADQRTRWALTKAWNSKYSKVGIPGQIRKELGEEASTILFQDTADDILADPELTGYIIDFIKDKDIEDWYNSPR